MTKIKKDVADTLLESCNDGIMAAIGESSGAEIVGYVLVLVNRDSELLIASASPYPRMASVLIGLDGTLVEVVSRAIGGVTH